MQRGVLLGAGAAVLIVGGALAWRGLGHHQASGVSAQTVDQMLATLLPGATIKHGAIDQDGLTGTLTIHDLAITRTDGRSWTAETLALSGVQAQAIHDVIDPAAYPDGHPAWTDRRKLLGEAVARHVHASLPTGAAGVAPSELSLDRVELHRLSGRPFALPPTPQNRVLPAFAADAALAFAAESASAAGLALVSQGTSAGKMTVSSIAMQDYDSGKAGSVAIKTVAMDVPGKDNRRTMHLTLDSAAMIGADYRGPLQNLQTTGKAAGMAFSYASAEAAGLAIQMTQGLAVTLHDIHAEQSKPAADGTRQGKAVLTALVLGLGELPVPASAAPSLDAFGMKAVTMDITAASRGRPGGAVDVNEEVVLHDLGTLHVDGALSDGTRQAGMAAGAAQAITALLTTTIAHAKLVWEDRSLTDRIFRVAAERAHTTPDLIRAQLAIPIVALSVMMPDQPDAADQLTRFLNHPHVLTVTLDPPEKVSLGEVARAPAVQRAHLLGVRIGSE